MRDTMNMIEELKSVIGREVSHNWSPTLRAKLVSVGEKYSHFEVCKTPHPIYSFSASKNHLAGTTFKCPNDVSWNCYFF